MKKLYWGFIDLKGKKLKKAAVLAAALTLATEVNRSPAKIESLSWLRVRETLPPHFEEYDSEPGIYVRYYGRTPATPQADWWSVMVDTDFIKRMKPPVTEEK